MPPGLFANFLNTHSIGGFSPSWQPGASFGFRASPQVSATWGTSLCLCSGSEEGPGAAWAGAPVSLRGPALCCGSCPGSSSSGTWLSPCRPCTNSVSRLACPQPGPPLPVVMMKSYIRAPARERVQTHSVARALWNSDLSQELTDSH